MTSLIGLQSIRSKGNIIQYAYDEVGNLTTLTYPGGKVVQYGYNAVNQLTSVTDWANRVTQYEYDANGHLTKTTRPDGSIQTMLYNAAGWLTQQKDIDKNGKIINQYDYTYDQVGKIIAEKSSKQQVPYIAANATMTYTKSNQLATYNGQAVQYDADGNMTSGPLKGSTANFAYDARNRLISAGNVSYGYDAENNRIAVITGGQQTGYVINPQAKLSQLLIKTDVQGKNTYYIYGLGLIGQEEADGTYKTYHFDNRGSTTAITDLQGNVTDTFGYGPFGELIQNQRTGTTDTPFQYNGRDGVMTDSNGLYYMRARYYNPDIKRFINQDVIQGSINNGQSMNRYAYVNGNPVSQVDPFGLWSLHDWLVYLNEMSFSILNGSITDDGGHRVITEYQAELSKDGALITEGELFGAGIGSAFRASEGYGYFLSKLKGAANAVKVDSETVIDSATSLKKGGESVVGHAFQKHAGRNPDIWGKVSGGPDQINQTALKHLEEIIQAPGDFVKVTNDRGITFIEKTLNDGRGVRLNLDGTFKGFIDQ